MKLAVLAAIMLLTAGQALAGPSAADLKAMAKAEKEIERCGPHLDTNLDDHFCKKLHDRSVTAKHCGILLGWTPHDPEQEVPWTQQRQELCEHLVNSGRWTKLDDEGQEELLKYLVKHAPSH